MGWYTLAIITNDAVHEFGEDPNVGSKLMHAVNKYHGEKVDVTIGNHSAAIEIVSNHHAAGGQVVVYNGPSAYVVGKDKLPEDLQFSKRAKRLMRELARELGGERMG